TAKRRHGGGFSRHAEIQTVGNAAKENAPPRGRRVAGLGNRKRAGRLRRGRSGRQRSAQIVELAGGTEELVAAGDELGVFVDEDLPRRAEVELAGIVAEEL